MKAENNKYRLDPYVTPIGAWALALGTSVGWGSLVVTSNTYLLKSGPWGSVFGLIIGAVIMLIISRNYHYMVTCFPDSGGAYTFSREAFGYDHGFLTAWFLGLTYIAVLWANATSLPLFARYFLGDMYQFGFSYEILGYKVYFGEALLSVAAIFIIAFLCIRNKRIALNIMVALVILFVAGITVCFVAAVFGMSSRAGTFEPGYIPNKDALSQLIRIACISPWAFIGFENISNSAEEFKFSNKKTFRILLIAVVSTTLLYIFVVLLSVTAFPKEYGTWLEYIKDLDNISGYKGLPAFYAAHYYLGNTGIYLMMAALLALIVTSLIGNITALSRLLYALSKDSIIPERFKIVSKWGTPARTIILIAIVSIPIPFLGRTAISWIVDVTTIGATIIYGLVSASAYKVAKKNDKPLEKWTGILGSCFMIGFGLYLLVPHLTARSTMAQETYLLFVVWGVLGFIYFRIILKKDTKWRFGKTIVVWAVLLTLILFIALIGMNQSMLNDTDQAMYSIHEHYTAHGDVPVHLKQDEAFIRSKMEEMQQSNLMSSFLVFALFLFSIITMMSNYSLIRKRAEESNQELGVTRTKAFRDPLTGVKSAHAFIEAEERLDERIDAGQIDQLAIVICDLNDLKSINDNRGHLVGDEYIKAASYMICNAFSHSPVYRVGGDEFFIIIEGRDYVSRNKILEDLMIKSEENVLSGKVVVAAGMAEYNKETDGDIRGIIERADEKMYENKEYLKGLKHQAENKDDPGEQ